MCLRFTALHLSYVERDLNESFEEHYKHLMKSNTNGTVSGQIGKLHIVNAHFILSARINAKCKRSTSHIAHEILRWYF